MLIIVSATISGERKLFFINYLRSPLYFTLKHKNKTYYIDFLDSDGHLGNRDYWQALDEEFEEIENEKLKARLIAFCIRHFNDYQPDYEEY